MRWWRCPTNLADSREVWRLRRELDLDEDGCLALVLRYYSAVSALFETGEIDIDDWDMLAARVAQKLSIGWRTRISRSASPSVIT